MASKGINKVIIVGNLGKEPEVKTFDNGGMIVNVSVATSDSWSDKNTGEKVEKTEWHKIVFKNKLAGPAADYLRKGSKVYVEGSLSTRSWKDKTGETKYITEIVANTFQMLDKRGETGMADAPNNAGQHEMPVGGRFDDDIPF